jgi:hypothetical protein
MQTNLKLENLNRKISSNCKAAGVLQLKMIVVEVDISSVQISDISYYQNSQPACQVQQGDTDRKTLHKQTQSL